MKTATQASSVPKSRLSCAVYSVLQKSSGSRAGMAAITDVHADAEVIFIQPGVVVLSRPHPSVPKPWQEVYEESEYSGQVCRCEGVSI
jgi:hypothetical protein